MLNLREKYIINKIKQNFLLDFMTLRYEKLKNGSTHEMSGVQLWSLKPQCEIKMMFISCSFIFFRV